MGSNQVQPFRVRVDLRVMAAKEYFTFPKALRLVVYCHILYIHWRRVFTHLQSAYSITPAVWTSKPTRVSSSLIGCPIHLALCYIEAKSFVNYYMGSNQVQPFRVRVDLRVMATNGRFHTPQNSRPGSSPSDAVWCYYLGDSLTYSKSRQLMNSSISETLVLE